MKYWTKARSSSAFFTNIFFEHITKSARNVSNSWCLSWLIKLSMVVCKKWVWVALVYALIILIFIIYFCKTFFTLGYFPVHILKIILHVNFKIFCGCHSFVIHCSGNVTQLLQLVLCSGFVILVLVFNCNPGSVRCVCVLPECAAYSTLLSNHGTGDTNIINIYSLKHKFGDIFVTSASPC